MATCKDCISFAECLDFDCTPYYGLDSACNNVEQLCESFKNKADFVEVKCRCKDCKHYKPQYNSPKSVVAYCCKSVHLKRNPNDFCSYGERRDT